MKISKKWGVQINSKTLPPISHNFSLSMDERVLLHPLKVSDLGAMAALLTVKLLHVLSPATLRCRVRKYCFTGVVGMLRFIPRRWLPCCRRRLLPKGRHFLARRPLELGLGSNIHVVSPPHSKICLKQIYTLPSY